MATYKKPIRGVLDMFNRDEYNYQNRPVTLSNLQIEIDSSDQKDDIQDELLNTIVSSTNNLTNLIMKTPNTQRFKDQR